MSSAVLLLLALAALALGALAFFAWRYWEDEVNRSPEDEELERSLASLNDAQANRVSDTQLTRPLSADDAWRTMVERGAKASPQRRRGRRGPDNRR